MLGGNLASLFISAIVHIAWSLAKPQNYDWKGTKAIALIVDDIEQTSASSVAASVVKSTASASPGSSAAAALASPDYGEEDSPEAMDRASKFMVRAGWLMTFVLVFLWPLLALPAEVFSEDYFTFWVAVSIIWGIVATAVGVFLPFYESRDAIGKISKGLWNLLRRNQGLSSRESATELLRQNMDKKETSAHSAGFVQ